MANHASPGFGVLLRHLREEAGLTQEALAERASLSERGLRYLETGAREPYPATVVRLAEALGLEPTARSRLSAAARGSSPPPAPHLPPAVSLIGRESALDDLRELVLGGARLVTVTGPGGVGKTSLAREAALAIGDALGEAVVWVPLERIDSAGQVLPAILAALGARGAEGPTPWIDRLAEALGPKRLLIVLDNVEHVVAAAPGIGEVLATCPAVTVIATSRVPLNVRAETEYFLPPLEAPDEADVADAQEARRWPAVALFERKARAVDRAFAVTDANARATARLCRELDGLPLSLELAAARVRVASPAEMLATRSRLDLLVGGPVDAPERQRTARATLEWSYGLLDPEDRELLRRLAVFRGGAPLAGVAAVARPEPGNATGPTARLEALRRASLVDRSEAQGVSRIHLLEVVREFAGEQLAAHPEEERGARDAHASFYADRALAQWPDIERRPAAVLAESDTDYGNLRAALDHLLRTGRFEVGLKACASTWVYWDIRGHVQEGISRLGDFLRADDDAPAGRAASPAARAEALLALSHLERVAGTYRDARDHAAESLALFRAEGDSRGITHALLGEAFALRLAGNVADARARHREGLSLARQIGHEHMIAGHLHHLGMIASMVDRDVDAARPLLEESLARFRGLGYLRFEALLLALLGSVEDAAGNEARADSLLSESLDLMALTGTLGVLWPLNEIARVAARRGRPRQAATLASAADRLRVLAGASRLPHVEAWLRALRESLGEPAFQEAWAVGCELSVEGAVALAISEGLGPQSLAPH
jgi:predicted ATPase/transcriptional regulator with XRE-family HTH domain